MLQILKLLFDRLWAALACPGGVHYVSGAQSLPPPLTPEEEKQLLARMMAGDAAARDELITHNLRLVVYLAKKYEGSGVPSEDMVSIGTIGLIKAVNTFTPGAEHQAGHLRQPLHRQRDPDVPAQKLQPAAGGQHRRAAEHRRRRQRAAAVGRAEQRGEPGGPAAGAGRRAGHPPPLGGAALRPGSGRSWSCASACVDGVERTQKEAADAIGISQSYISRLEKRIIRAPSQTVRRET